MHGGPRYTKPAHQYGQPSGDQAEVLAGGLPSIPAEAKVVTAAPAPDEVVIASLAEDGCEVPDIFLGYKGWAGKGFDTPYVEPE